MSGIIVTAEDLDRCAEQVTALKSEMENTFSQIRSMIQGMNAFWQSPASADAAAQFEQLSPVFPKYISIVNNYTTYLKQTAAAYRDNEAALGGKA